MPAVRKPSASSRAASCRRCSERLASLRSSSSAADPTSATLLRSEAAHFDDDVRAIPSGLEQQRERHAERVERAGEAAGSAIRVHHATLEVCDQHADLDLFEHIRARDREIEREARLDHREADQQRAEADQHGVGRTARDHGDVDGIRDQWRRGSAPSANMRDGLALDRRIAVCARYIHATTVSAHA
jgi:hypothetical protein